MKIDVNFNSFDILVDGKNYDLSFNGELSMRGSGAVFTREGYKEGDNVGIKAIENNEPNEADFIRNLEASKMMKEIQKIINE